MVWVLAFEPLVPCDFAHMHYNESGRLYTLCPKQIQGFEYHSLIECFAFDHIRPHFPHIIDQAQSLFFSQPQCALSIATFISKVLEHRDLLLTFTRIT